MSRRAVLWVAFAVVHVSVAWLGFVLPSEPMGDVYRVYEPWSACALWGQVEGFCPDGRAVMGLGADWIYPPPALIPMLAAWLVAWPGGYTVGWAVLVTLVDAAVFALLVGSGRSTGRSVAAAFWLAFLALLGPVALYRLDGLTTPIALAGCLWLVPRPRWAAALLALATWIKVWPAALLAAALLAVRRRVAIVAGAAGVSVVVLGFAVAVGGVPHALSFVSGQTDRGLQVEAPVSMVYLWLAASNAGGAHVYYDAELLTFQVTGPQVDVVIQVMTPLLLLLAAAIVLVGAVKAVRGAKFAVLFPPLALALTLAVIVFNKVGSPQYACWIAAPLAAALVLDRHRWWKPASLGLAIALLTQLVYPLLYDGVLIAAPLPVLVLTVRNVLYGVLLVWALARLARVSTRMPAHQPAPALF